MALKPKQVTGGWKVLDDESGKLSPSKALKTRSEVIKLIQSMSADREAAQSAPPTPPGLPTSGNDLSAMSAGGMGMGMGPAGATPMADRLRQKPPGMMGGMGL